MEPVLLSVALGQGVTKNIRRNGRLLAVLKLSEQVLGKREGGGGRGEEEMGREGDGRERRGGRGREGREGERGREEEGEGRLSS